MGKNKTKSHKKHSKKAVKQEQTVIDESDDEVTVASEAEAEDSSQVEEKVQAVKQVETFEEVSKRFSENISDVKRLISTLYKDYQVLEKLHRREVKDARKNRRNKGSAKRDVKSGFNKPTPVPEAVAKLFDIEEGTLLARTVVTKMIYQYIKDKGLQNEEDKRQIHPDSKIRKLFQLGKDDQLTFQNFQTHMKKLYPKTQKATTSTENA